MVDFREYGRARHIMNMLWLGGQATDVSMCRAVEIFNQAVMTCCRIDDLRVADHDAFWEDAVDFCLSKCGEAYCWYINGKGASPYHFPCLEFICWACQQNEIEIKSCNFCKGGIC